MSKTTPEIGKIYRSSCWTAATVLWIVLIAGVCSTQDPGDAVLAHGISTSTLVRVTPTGNVHTLFSYSGMNPVAMTMGPANGCVLVVKTNHILEYRQGILSTFQVLPPELDYFQDILVDDSGDLVLLEIGPTTRGLYRIPGNGGPVTTVFAGFPASASGMALVEDLHTGDLLVLDGDSYLHRIDMNGKARSTLLSMPTTGSNFNAHVDFNDGTLLIARGTSVYRVDPRTAATTSIKSGVTSLSGIDHDPFNGGYYLVDWYLIPPVASLVRFSPSTPSTVTIASWNTISVSDVVTWESRVLNGIDAPIPGGSYPVHIRLHTEAGQSYQAAASLGFTAGIVSGRHRICLDPDPLFFLSLINPAVFQNFSGTLNAQGAGMMTVNIPPVVPRGFRFFLAVVTFDSSGIRAVSETLGVNVR